MVSEGILEQQIKPTPWVSSVTYPVKPSGEVRSCLDARDLNRAIIRENHKPQTVEEIAHQLVEVTVFTKADALKASLQVHLTEESSKLLVINTHKGRYRFKRMPFGAKMSQDVFQMKMDIIMEKCPGVISIHDDIVIYGTSDQDHDANLINLLNVAQLEGLVLNSKKLELKRPKVSFFGAEYSVDGMHPCPKKIQGITEMTPPIDKQQLASFIGMVTYMGNFVPHLSHHTEPLRAMLKQDAVFHWDEATNASFQKIKDLIAKSASQPLRYYDRTRPVTVQADASQRGLGACLVQEGKPIAFASKSLTDTETRYANIERELLAIVFACQRFNTYMLGRQFTVESDHKPLEMIHQKSLASAPPRLQCMLLQLQRYDLTIKYRPGKDMLFADALSRCPARGSEEIKLDMHVNYVAFNKAWIAKLKEATWEDPITSTVYQLTQQGWPHRRRHTPRMARVYWDFRDELSTDDGLLLKGPRIVILSCLHEEYLERLHYGHLSASKIQDNTRQHLYWPGLDADITDYVRRCQECIKKAHPPKEPLQAHDVPSQPWERIAMDHFYQNGRLYLLVCNYFSKFPFIFQTKSTSFANIKEQLEELFGLEGAPDEIMSDNGPPFSSKEFNSFLSGLGIKHTTSSPNYPQSNGFIERQIQTVKRLMEKSRSTGRSFQEALTGLRATPIAEGMSSPAEILHGRNLTTRKAISVDLNAVRQHLIQLQAKYIKQHDKARRARSQRALVIGEEVYHLSTGNNWVISIISGTRDSGRSYDILTEGCTSLRRNRSHLKPRSHDIPMLNQAFISGPHTPSQSEAGSSISGPAHPSKEKYSLTRTNHNNHFSNISGPAHPPKEKYSLSGPTHPPKVKYSHSQPQSVLKLIIRCYGDTAYDSYIAETMVPLRSAFKPRKQTRFESDPVTSVRHIPARCSNTQPTPRRNLDPLDPDLLIPIELSQASQGNSVQDLGESEAGEAYDTSIAHTPPSQPCGQIQAQRNDNNSRDSIAHFRTNTSSQSEIFSELSNASYSSYTEAGTSTDIHEEYTTPSQTGSEVTSSAYSSDSSRTTTSSQREIFSETATKYDASSEASSCETSRPSSPESGNLTVRSVYSPLPEMAIVHKTMHDAIHTVRDQQGRAVTRRFLQKQQQLAASKLKCMSQIRKTSTPDPPPPKSNAFPR